MLEQLGVGPFLLYPPIRNFVHNEWRYRKASWSDLLIQNTKTLEEIWIPRMYFGAVSYSNDLRVIVRLTKELEYREAAVWPVKLRVIEMPVAVDAGPRQPGRLAPVVGIRIENERTGLAGRFLIGGIALGILLVSIFRGGVLIAPILLPAHSKPAPATAAR